MSSFEPRPITAEVANEFSAERDERAAPGFVPFRAGETPAVEEVPAGPSEEEIRQAAYDEGFAAGRAQLPWQEAESLRGLIETLEKSLESVARLRRDLLRDSRETSVELALAIAERLVRRQITLDPAPMIDVVKRAIEAMPDESKLRVALSSDDFEVLQLGLSEELAGFGAESGVVLEATAELGRGDVRVHGDRGGVDARLPSLLQRVREGLDALYELPENEESPARAETADDESETTGEGTP